MTQSLPVLNVRPDADQWVWTFGGAHAAGPHQSGHGTGGLHRGLLAGRMRGPDDLVSKVCEFPFLNPQSGPFYVAGAEVGDTLAVHFVSIARSG